MCQYLNCILLAYKQKTWIYNINIFSKSLLILLLLLCLSSIRSYSQQLSLRDPTELREDEQPTNHTPNHTQTNLNKMKTFFLVFCGYVVFGSAFIYALDSGLDKSQAIHCANGISRACDMQRASY